MAKWNILIVLSIFLLVARVLLAVSKVFLGGCWGVLNGAYSKSLV